MNTVKSDMALTLSLDWLTQFTASLEAAGRSARTVAAYCQDVRQFALWFELVNGQPFSPDLLTGVDLRAYRAHALETGMAPSTFNRRRSALAVLAAWAIQQGHLTYNPMQGVDRLDEQPTAPRWLEPHEIHRLLRQVEQRVNGAGTTAARLAALRDQAMIALMLHAGLRVEEVSLLDVADVPMSERKGRVIVRQGKGSKRREVPLNSEARRALRLWLEASVRSDGPLFVGKRHSERMGVSGIQERLDIIRQAAGLDADVTPHALRHTFAKRLADQGTHLNIIQGLLGHSRLETTARYTQPGWGDFERAVEKSK